MEMVRNALMQNVFWRQRWQEIPCDGLEVGEGEKRIKNDTLFSGPHNQETANASEGEQWHWTDEARFQVRPCRAWDPRDWLEQFWVTSTEGTAWALREKCAELTTSMHHVNVYLVRVLWSMPTYAKEVMGRMANQRAGPKGDNHLAPTGRGVCPVLQDSIIWRKKLHIHIFI